MSINHRGRSLPYLPVAVVPLVVDSPAKASSTGAASADPRAPQTAPLGPPGLRPRSAAPKAGPPRRSSSLPKPGSNPNLPDNDSDWRNTSQAERFELQARVVMAVPEMGSGASHEHESGDKSSSKDPRHRLTSIAMGAAGVSGAALQRPAAETQRKLIEELARALVSQSGGSLGHQGLARVKHVLMAELPNASNPMAGSPLVKGDAARNALLPLMLLSMAQRLTAEQQAMRAARGAHIRATMEGVTPEAPLSRSPAASKSEPDHEC